MMMLILKYLLLNWLFLSYSLISSTIAVGRETKNREARYSGICLVMSLVAPWVVPCIDVMQCTTSLSSDSNAQMWRQLKHQIYEGVTTTKLDLNSTKSEQRH